MSLHDEKKSDTVHSQLPHLELEEDIISAINANTEFKLNKLATLDLTGFELKSLPEWFGDIDEYNTLRKLRLSNNELTSLPYSIGNFKNLKALYLSYNQLTSLPESIGNLQTLQEFNLQNNQLTSLPESIGNLQSLIVLSLNKNQLKYLPDSIGNLQHLHYLSLSNNKLTSLPDSIENLPKLKNLYIDNNPLSSLKGKQRSEKSKSLPHLGLEKDIISALNANKEFKLDKLGILDLSDFKLKTLPEWFGDIDEYNTLYSLHLNKNQLTSLPESIGSLQKLENLYLSVNQLISLPESIGNLLSLQGLYLSDNQLTSLPESIGNLQMLKELYLSNNQLTSLPESIGNLQKLKILYLSNNQLTSLPESIGNLQKLKILYLKNNQLTSLPNSITNLNLKHLSFKGNNNLTSLPLPKKLHIKSKQGFNQSGSSRTRKTSITHRKESSLKYKSKLSKITSDGFPIAFFPYELLSYIKKNEECRLNKDYDTLILGHHSLSSLPNWFGNIINKEDGTKYFIRSINLSFNNLNSLPDSFSNFESLNYLTLSNNQFDSIPEIVGKLNNLSGLNFSNNQIASFTIENLHNLHSLELSNNKILSIPTDIGNLTKLQYILALDNNLIKSIPESIGNLTKLQVLSLNNNALTSLPDSIGKLTNLTSLYLYNNQLTYIPASIGNLHKLMWLYLENNNITSLPSTINNLHKLYSIKFDKNISFSLVLPSNRKIKDKSTPFMTEWTIEKQLIQTPKQSRKKELSISNSDPKSLLSQHVNNSNHFLYPQYVFIRNLDEYSLDFLNQYTQEYYKLENRKKQIDRFIENLFKQIPPTTKDFKVYRGVTHFPFDKERNFISTSLNQKTAHEFINKKNLNCCILVINVKSGSKVLPLIEISNFQAEDEVLIHGNGIFTLKQQRMTDSGIMVEEPKSKTKTKVPKQMSKSYGSKPYKMKRYYIDYYYPGPMSALENLRIITFNIGARIQMNKEEGTEKEFVKLCKTLYYQTDGLSSVKNNTHVLSQCSWNAAQWLAKQNAGLIGLQEVVEEYIPLLMQAFPKSYQCVGHDSARIIYDENLLGKGTMLSSAGTFVGGDNRPMVILWFSQPKLLVVNLHAEHNIRLKSEITNVFESVMTSQAIVKEDDIDRIIVTGDFNDPNSSLKSLHLAGLTLKQHHDLQSIMSCCADSSYRYGGDYIFDSDFNIIGKYGIPESGLHPYENKNGFPVKLNENKPMSDHDPVVFYPGL